MISLSELINMDFQDVTMEDWKYMHALLDIAHTAIASSVLPGYLESNNAEKNQTVIEFHPDIKSFTFGFSMVTDNTKTKEGLMVTIRSRKEEAN